MPVLKQKLIALTPMKQNVLSYHFNKHAEEGDQEAIKQKKSELSHDLNKKEWKLSP